MEENSNPEEDFSLPQTHQLNREELAVRGDSDLAEEDFATVQETRINRHSMSVEGETNVDLVTGCPDVNEISAVEDVESDENSSIVSSKELIGIQEGDKELYLSNITGQFEEKVKISTAELINMENHEACSDDDSQSPISQETRPSHYSSNTMPVEHEFQASDLSKISVTDVLSSGRDTPDIHESSRVVAATVNHAAVLNDTPEGASCGSGTSSCKEAVDLSLCLDQHISAGSGPLQHSLSCLGAQFVGVTAVGDLGGADAEHTPRIQNSVLAVSNEEVDNKLDVKCDNQAVLFSESAKDTCREAQTVQLNESPNDTCHEAQTVQLNESSNDTCHEAQTVQLNESSKDTCHEAQTVQLNESPNDTCHEAQTVQLNKSPKDTCHEAHTVQLKESPNDSCHETQTVQLNESPNDSCHETQTVQLNESPNDSCHETQTVQLNESPNDSCHETQTVQLNESPNDTCHEHETQTVQLNESPNDSCHETQTVQLNESPNDSCHETQTVQLNESPKNTCHEAQTVQLNESSKNTCHEAQTVQLNESSNDPHHEFQTVQLNESPNNICHEFQTVHLKETVEDPHHSFLGDQLLATKQEVLAADLDQVSQDCTEAVSDMGTRASNIQKTAITILSSDTSHNTSVSAFQVRTPCPGETQGGSEHHSSSDRDGCFTKPTNNSPIHQQNILHADNPKPVFVPEPVRQEETQPQTVHPISKLPYPHNSIPAQEICNNLHSDSTHKTENGLLSRSASLSPPTNAISNVDEHRSFAYESHSLPSSAASPSLPTDSPNKFTYSPGDPHNSNRIPSFDSTSLDSSPPSSQQSSPAKTLSTTSLELLSYSAREQSSALQNSSEYEIFQDLHALLLAYASGSKPLHTPQADKESGLQENRNIGQIVNGQQPLFGFSQIQDYNRQLLEQMKIRDEEIAKLSYELSSVREARAQSYGQDHILSSSHQADDLYLPQIKVLEHTIAQQQKEIQALKIKLASQDASAKRAITSLQNELKSRVGQVNKMYEDCVKEKDSIVIRFAESEAKNMEAKRITERSEAKVKEVMKDKEIMLNALKAAKAEKQKALSNFETKIGSSQCRVQFYSGMRRSPSESNGKLLTYNAKRITIQPIRLEDYKQRSEKEISGLQKELEKLKESVTSSEHHAKWFQSKLSVEAEEHKETKSNLEKTLVKLKEAREETEMIRKECHAIVKRYQESEEIKSNSLDKELKLKETELRTQLQERNDNEEIHQMLKRELDSLKVQHKDTIEEAKTYKDKVQCLEDERRQNHLMIENYQEIMQRQKTSNAELNARITSFSSLENEYKSAQDMLLTLESDISDLQAANEELQKDMDSCRERESKMLSLQSELSHANALLRSENSSLNNKISALTGDLEKCKREVQTLEATIKALRDKCDKDRAKYKEEGEKMTAILTDRTKECNDLRQKWEDELDNSKTLKRRHTSNIKDLTRQLHQVHRRLESIEGKDSGSMGSRTNSNGSLNSLENASRPSACQPVQEFPVITEQVEVDKHVLIERIVRLQKSLARKNEKLEFLGEHIQQLLEDIKKKNKVIQFYALREESGTMSSENMDANKAKVQKEMQTLLARKGGIMASLYSAQQQDGSMTLELSLQISRKLQAVLEDTLLKNITLKESLDTLGEEIARLSQENRKLQLHLQKIEANVA